MYMYYALACPQFNFLIFSFFSCRIAHIVNRVERVLAVGSEHVANLSICRAPKRTIVCLSSMMIIARIATCTSMFTHLTHPKHMKPMNCAACVICQWGHSMQLSRCNCSAARMAHGTTNRA